MTVKIEDVDDQIRKHVYSGEPNYLMKNEFRELCRGAECPEIPGEDSCEYCIGDYNIAPLLEVQPHLTWLNLKETIILAQCLGIEPENSK